MGSDAMTIPSSVRTHAIPLIMLMVFLAGCQQPTAMTLPPAPTGPASPATTSIERPIDVWLLPIEGFPPELTDYLRSTFSRELPLNIKASVQTGRSAKMFGPNRQMIAEQALAELQTAISRLYDVTPKTVFIILTADDLNGAGGGTRFVFAQHFHQARVSIVSIARLRDSFFGGTDSPAQTKTRLYKMVKKSLGLQFYLYDRSTELRSVMYSPINSLDDLDASGTQF